MKKEYVYRISIGLRVICCFVCGVILLGSYGYLGDSFVSDNYTKTLSLSVSLPLLLITFLSPYKNSYIEIHDNYITIPSLFIPPFTTKRMSYSEINSVDFHSDDNGMESLILRTKNGKAKINGYFCYESLRLTLGAPDEFWKIANDLLERYEQYKA